MSRRTAFAQLAAEMAKPREGPNGERLRYWYLWNTDGPDTFDCSGFVAWCLKMVGGPDWAKTWWSERMWRELPIVIGKPEAGDLALYGWPGISHVMICMADGCVVGASGGDATTTSIELARHKNAFVKKHITHLYRRDFRGFRKLEPLDK